MNFDRIREYKISDVSRTEYKKDDSDNLDIGEKQKVYQHFPDSVSDINEHQIDNYQSKKRELEISSLNVRKEILSDYQNQFNREALERIKNELDSNKIELYSDDVFQIYISPDKGSYITMGARDMDDGKIAVRDSDDVSTLKHTGIHETVHDMSYQDKREMVIYESDDEHEKIIDEVKISGIHENHVCQKYIDGLPLNEKMYYGDKNMGLNEGITEMYTVDMLRKLQIPETYESYTQQTAWAMYIRDKLGDDLVSAAYYGGKTSELKTAFDDACGTPGSWEMMNNAIDQYSKISDDNKDMKKQYKETVDNFLLQLEDDQKIKVKKL